MLFVGSVTRTDQPPSQITKSFGHMPLPVTFPAHMLQHCELSILSFSTLNLSLLQYLGFLRSKIAKRNQKLQWSSGYDIRLTSNVRREGSRDRSSVAVLFLLFARGLGVVGVGVVIECGWWPLDTSSCLLGNIRVTSES